MRRKREVYYQMIWQYEKRRAALIAERKELTQRSKNLTKRIKIWRKQIRNMDEVKTKVIAIGNAVAIFTAVNPKGCGGKKGVKRLNLSKGLFYKYCLENGIPGNILREYTGDKSANTPGVVRKSFTKQIRENPEIKQLWLNFKEGVNQPT